MIFDFCQLKCFQLILGRNIKKNKGCPFETATFHF